MKVFLAFGTNLGDRYKNIDDALRMLGEEVGPCLRVSSRFETEPWGFVSEHAFLNAVAEFDTRLTALELLHITQVIERRIGRLKKSAKGVYADRLIDIDILLYGNEQIDTDQLVVPHPLMLQRRFVMDPLLEIAPELIHPVYGKPMSELAGESR